MIPTLYRGSVKEVLGPVDAGKHGPFVVFQYSDAYSVFDWGKMPDALPGKGDALSVIGAHLFEQIEKADTWKQFSKTPEALSLRKGNKSGAAFNELGEKIQGEGIRTHYFGVLEDPKSSLKPKPLSELGVPSRHMMVRQVSVVHPKAGSVLGRSVYDYRETRASAPPRLIPLEVVFRFSLPPGSSLLERMKRAGQPFEAGHTWDFPYLELFTKLESTDRLVTIPEALAISGVSSELLQEVLFKTAWVAGLLKHLCARAGLELADGKLEWGIDADGTPVLVDAIGPDELRILAPKQPGGSALLDGVQLSKEFLRAHYRATPWYAAMQDAKAHAEKTGTADWKRFCTFKPEPLPAKHRELASQVYLALANVLGGRGWFPGAPDLKTLVREISAL